MVLASRSIGKVNRYYNGVPIRPTTICCSALALSLSLIASLTTQPLTRTSQSSIRPAGLLSLFPTAPAWSVSIESGVALPPGFDDARAFVPLADGQLAAYDLATGKMLWTVTQATSATPVAAEDRVVLIEDTEVIARDAETGDVVWQYPVGSPVKAPVTLIGGWAIVPESAGTIAALRLEDGGMVWTRTLESSPAEAATVEGIFTMIPTVDGQVIALALDDGRRLWTRRLGGRPQPVLAVDDRVYVGADDNYFYCLRLSDGRVEWRWRTGADIVGVAAFDDRRVYFAALDNVLRALDRRSGAQRWKRALTVRPTAGPVLAADALLVASQSATIHGFLTKDGAPAGDIDAGGVLVGVPHVAEPPAHPAPLVIYTTGSVTSGATMAAVTRRIEPPVTPIVPLPNPAPLPPPPEASTTSPDGGNR